LLYWIGNIAVALRRLRGISLDLFKLTNLKGVVPGAWVTVTFRKIETKNLQRILPALSPRASVKDTALSETLHQGCPNLDCLVFRFWISHSLLAKVMYESREGRFEGPRGRVESVYTGQKRRGGYCGGI